MDLIARYQNAGFEAVADGVMAFFDRRTDLQRPGVAFGPGVERNRTKCRPISVWWRLIAAISMLLPCPT